MHITARAAILFHDQYPCLSLLRKKVRKFVPGLYNLYLCLEKGMHMGSDVCVILYTLTSLVLALTVCLLGAGLTGG